MFSHTSNLESNAAVSEVEADLRSTFYKFQKTTLSSNATLKLIE
jgi:hypothetical protein